MRFIAAWGYAKPLAAAKLRTNSLERWGAKKEDKLRMAGTEAVAAVLE